MNFKKIFVFVQIFLVVSLVFSLSLTINAPVVNAEQQVCCEKDNGGNYCNYVPESQCTGKGILKASTSCDQTSFCKAGCCAGVNGFCYSNYPKALCEKSYGGSFSNDQNCNGVSECKLGCCVIGTQAAYLTRNRCISETSKYPDLQVDFRDNVNNEQDCLNLARNTEKGCCVTSDRNCKYGAKSECNVQTQVNGTGFYVNTPCSSLPNQCDCAPHKSGDPRATTCLPNDDKVYWKDSCGNPEGVVTGIDLRPYGSATPDGNCDYNKGTLCGPGKDGTNICQGLDCQGGTTPDENKQLSVNLDNYAGHGTLINELGQDGILNGESWCAYDSPDQTQLGDDPASTVNRNGQDPVGSRYYRHICISGQELVEPCKDFREEYCYSNSVDVTLKGSQSKKYTESRCLKNEWQPCVNECNTANPETMNQYDYTQALKKDYDCCLKSTSRDCFWNGNRCVPAVTPGFKFWEGEGSNTCTKANTKCTILFRCNGWNSLFGSCGASKSDSGAVGATIAGVGGAILAGFLSGGLAAVPIIVGGGLSATIVGVSEGKNAGWQILSGGECLSQDYLQAANNLCRSMGDCGANFNYQNGYASSGNKDNTYTLGISGFSNSQLANKELVTYSKENTDAIKATKSNSARGDITLGFDKNSDTVPGNLTDSPDWNFGTSKSFYNYNIGKKELSNNFVRAVFGSPDVTTSNSGAFGPLAIGAYTSVASGIIGAGLGSTFGATAAGFGIGFSSSPLGFLVSKLTGFVSKSAATKLGFSGGEEALQAGVKSSWEQSLSTGRSLSSIEQGAFKDTLQGYWSKAGDSAIRDVTSKLTEKDFQLLSSKLPEGQSFYIDKELGIVSQNTAVGDANPNFLAKITEKQAEDITSKAGDKVAQTKVQTGFQGVMTGVSAALWIYTIYQLGDALFEDMQTQVISTTCSPWQAPVYKVTSETDPCSKCNPQNSDYLNPDKTPKDVRAFATCSEYRCKSLGASCSLINKGTNNELCVSLNKLDTVSPKVQPWFDAFTLNITDKDIVYNNTNGFLVKKEIPIYTPFVIGIQTDEPSQCKMSLQHSKRYIDMENNFFGGNVFSYFHANTMVYPGSVNSTGSGITLNGGGHYKLYMRCTDAVGNANEADYVIEFDVSNEPDLTAPSIVGSSLSPPVSNDVENQTVLAKEVYLMSGANYTDISLFVNEPAECRYSYVPLEFSSMNSTNSCKTAKSTPDAPPYFSCNFVRGVKSFAGIGPAPSGFTSKAGLAQYVYFKCIDHPEAGYTETRNFNKEAYTVVLRGSDSLHIDSAGPSGIIKTSSALVDVTLQVQTSGGSSLNGKSTCKYTTEVINKNNLAAMTEFVNTGSNLHTQPWSPSSGEQKFYVGCYDQAGNRDFAVINFNVEKDISPPMIIKTYVDKNFQPSQFIIELNEQGQCKDSTDGIFSYDVGGNLMNAVGSSGKVFTSTTPNSNIYYVLCRDLFNNTIDPAVIQIAQVQA